MHKSDRSAYNPRTSLRHSTLSMLLLIVHVASNPHILSITPASGPSSGGFRITIHGTNLPVFAFQANVLIEGGGECKSLLVLQNFRVFTCIMPACQRCGDRDLRITAISGEQSNKIKFHYDEECFDGANPSLPRRYSGAENCAVCTSLIHLTLASSGDLVTYATLRAAMLRACSSSLLQDWGRVNSPSCRIDLTAGCIALFHTSADVLLDSIYSNWVAGYVTGKLPLLACRDAGQCTS